MCSGTKLPEGTHQRFVNFATVYLPLWLQSMEFRLLGNAPNLDKDPSGMYIVGDKITIADFVLASAVFSIFYNEGNPRHQTLRKIYESYPKLHRYADTMRIRFLDYLEVRPKTLPY